MSLILGRPLLCLEEVPSTNDLVKARAEEGGSEGWTIVAGRQTAGRGRCGRKWESNSAGGLYMSVLLRPDWPADESARLAVVGGVAVYCALETLGVRGLSLKWPNDVLVRGRKVSGILVEPRISSGRIEFAVVGIGVNVGQSKEDWTEEVRQIATSCALEGVNVSRSSVALKVLEQLDYHYRWMQRGGFESIQKFWNEKVTR
jgi:BirA family biotin operon repressor/biotin-[acetyl-CoA-carboxylase] ligase